MREPAGEPSAPRAAVDDRERLLQMLFGFFPAQVLRTLAALGVADALRDGPADAATLAARTGTDADALGRLLRAAAGLDLVAADGDRYALTSAGRLLTGDAPGSVGALAQLFCGEGTWDAWGELPWSVRTGETAFEKVTGQSAFAYIAADPGRNAVFTAAMAEGTRNGAPGIVASCDLTGVGTLADLGGGNGTLLAAFLTAHPDVRGIVLDSADGLAGAAETLAAAGVDGRAEAVAGDFFAAVPAADAYVVKSVVHDWDDARSVALLSRARAAMHPGAVLFLVEPVVPTDAPVDPITLMSDLNMLVCTGGRERTLAEFTALLDAAGLALADVTRVPPPTGYSVLKAVPA